MAFVCCDVGAHTHFVFDTEVISIAYLIREEELSGGAVFNDNLLVCRDWLSKTLDPQVRVIMKDFPRSIIDGLSNHGDFLVAREASEGERADLGAVKVDLLANQIWVALESNLLTVPDNIVGTIIFYSSDCDD